MKIKQLICLCLSALTGLSAASAQGKVWSVEKANAWGEKNPWYCGVNYIPANAVNYTAMWDKTSFSPEVIDREMRLMKETGMNCARVVMQHAVYEDDPAYFLRTLDTFLGICAKYGVKVMPIFIDDCAFGVNTDPTVGRQPEPLEGWYAWAWSPSPGYSMVVDERTHGRLEKYVKEVMTRFRDDDRIFVWDLYNEPTNTPMPERSWPLLRKVFAWAREVGPSQPITSGMWNGNKELNDFLSANSDIITFHIYAPKAETERVTKEYLALGRPTICTEWMNRVAKSNILDILPFFKETHTGCMLWGLVNGKTQTHLCWGHRPEHMPYTREWQHDIYHGDYTPYKPEEIALIRKMTKE